MERQDVPKPAKAVPLRAMFSQARGQSPSAPLLSRKDRYALAAAASWAVLYLAGSPWIAPDWSGHEELQMLFENHQAPELRHHPTISSLFKKASGQPVYPSAPTINPPIAHQLDQLRSSLIRNRTLFSLGIILIELCLNRSFDQLRQEIQADSFSASLGVKPDDYEIADALMQRVYLEAGDFYGYAVQRCLRCEFPGRDISKSFEFEQFRKDFFSYVVAPVQATFSLLPSTFALL